MCYYKGKLAEVNYMPKIKCTINITNTVIANKKVIAEAIKKTPEKTFVGEIGRQKSTDQEISC